MNQITYKKPFNIYLAGTKTREPEYIKTIEIDCYWNFGQDFVCPHSHKQIEREKLKAIFWTNSTTIKQKAAIFIKYFYYSIVKPRIYRFFVDFDSKMDKLKP